MILINNFKRKKRNNEIVNVCEIICIDLFLNELKDIWPD